VTTSPVRPAGALASLRALVLAALAPMALAAQVPSAPQAQPAGQPARQITLDEAVRLAQRNSPTTVQSAGNIRTAAAAAGSAWSAFLPSLSVNTGVTQNTGSRFDPQRDEIIEATTSWQYSNGYSAQMLLFDGGDRIFQLRQARQNVNAAQAGDIAQRYTVRLNVAQQYYNVLAARETQAAAQAQLDQAEQQLRVSSARVAAGAATRSDSLRAIIQVGNARLALLQAINALNSANAALSRLVATPFLVTAIPSDTLTEYAPLPDSAALVRWAAAGPAVNQATAQLRAARSGERSAWTSYLPTVGLRYDRFGNGSTPNFDLSPDQVVYANRLSIGLSFPIFNNWQREEARVRADVAEDIAEAQQRDALLLAQQTLVQNLGTLRTAQERVTIQLASVAAAEEDLRVQQQRYALGASTQLDVLTSQTQLGQARAQLIQARYDLRVARASIEALIGRPLP
jgi:outer membrane protein